MASKGRSLIDRPLIILSAPRAGSTLLFEALAKHPNLWSIGGESHALIEHIPELSTLKRGYVSNRLEKIDAKSEVISVLHNKFLHQSINHNGDKYTLENGVIRLLEKTPKNALRVNFLNEVFPDAKFVYLARDPLENISSILDAWRSRRFVTYPDLPMWPKNQWSLLLSDNWKDYIGSSLVEIATHQWSNANKSIIDSLEKIDLNRVTTVCYQDLVNTPNSTLNKIYEFADLELMSDNTSMTSTLPLSRYTLTTPQADKWLKNITDLSKVKSQMENGLKPVNKWLSENGLEPFLSDISTRFSAEKLSSIDSGSVESRQSRNEICACGSGKKFKYCHGRLS
ncbi:sulfotransferase [uncultured Paraglaciecola sp.]|uniref:sulfotransferase n=1 Tax=uncultured Paraglaciecola sp. TaxID=1765024 RepID=UPI002598D6EC|nr:sulfotransferase [uncultured Paraglaciecola sp.]